MTREGELVQELIAEIKRLAAFVAEWSNRFGFLAEKHARDSIESIDEVACVLGAEHKRLKEELAVQQAEIERLSAIVQRIQPTGEYLLHWWELSARGSCVEIKAENDMRKLMQDAAEAAGKDGEPRV